MHQDILSLVACERIEAMLREAHSYRLAVERAPLRFGEPLERRVRRGLSRSLVRLAERVAPANA